MARRQIRNTLEGTAAVGILKDLADSINGGARAHADAIALIYHAGKDTVISVATVPPTDLPESLIATNELLVLLRKHLADGAMHKVASAEDLSAIAFATDQATAETAANAVKASLNVHHTEAGVHFNNDATNGIAAADASNLATLLTLLTEMQTDWDLHVDGDALAAPDSVGDIIEIIDV